MKRILRRQDFKAPLVVAEFAGEFEKPFAGLRAAVAKKQLARPDEADELFGQQSLRLVVVKIGGVDQFARLLHQRRRDVRRRVAQRANGDAPAHVQVAFPVDVPHIRTLAALQYDVEARIGGDDVFLKALLDGLDFVPHNRRRVWQNFFHLISLHRAPLWHVCPASSIKAPTPCRILPG